MIWKNTVEPRAVEIRIRGESYPFHMFNLTPVPAPLQTCREARNLGLYKQAFSEVEALVSHSMEPRYVWLNLEIDIISIGIMHLSLFEPVAASIRRLRLERRNLHGGFFDEEYVDIIDFVNLEEVYVVCADRMETWHGFTESEQFWSCGVEDFTFIDPYDGRVMKSLDMERMFDEMGEEEVRRRVREIEVRGRWEETC